METGEAPSATTKVYKYRWIILLVYCAYISISFAQFLEYTIIANIVKKYYNVSSIVVDLTALIYYVVFILLFIPTSIFIDHYGLKWAAVITSGLTAGGNLLKLLSVSQDRFYLVLMSQGLCAIGQVFSLMIPSKLAGTWFGPREVSTACAIAVLGTQLGIAVGCVIPSSFVSDSDSIEQIQNNLLKMIQIYAGASSVIFIITLTLFKAKPQLPPSISQLNLLEHERGLSFTQLIKNLLTVKDFLILLACFGVSVGIWTMFGIMFNSIYLEYFPGEVQTAGLLALAAMILGGCIGSVLFGYMLDKFHKFKLTSIAVLALASLMYMLVIFALEARCAIATYIVIPLFGFFMGSTTAISFEYSVEVTYPVQEKISCAVINAAMCLFSLIFTFIVETLFTKIGYLHTNIIINVALILCTSSLIFVSSKLSRQDANGNTNI